jgi:hypothetical protein
MAGKQVDRQTGKIPSFREAAPEWARLSDKLAELTATEAQLIEELRPLNEKLARTGQFSLGMVRRQKPNEEDRSNVAVDHPPGVKKLLGDLAPPVKSKENFLVFEGPEKARWRELSEELDSVRMAISLIHEPLKKAWLDGSAAYCQHVAPDYRNIASGVCAALIALGRAVMAHEEFAKALRQQGVAWGMLRPVSLSALGNPLDASSEISRALMWAIECGHVHVDDIPSEWAAHRGKK